MLKEALEMHNNLNPALWDKDGNLLPEVEDRIYKIVNKFQSECMLPLDIVDVHLVGSNASFNYNPQSDLDVHIVVNFDLLDVDKEILTAAYNLQKAQFNRDYDISIHGVNIEMYIEDINSMTASNGIYSLYNKKWIKKPVNVSSPATVQTHLDRLADKMKQVVSSDDEVEITKNINMLYMMRKNGLATDGEFSIGNLLFKEIRNLGLLDELKQRLKEVQSDKLTLEQMNEGKFSNNKTTRTIAKSLISKLIGKSVSELNRLVRTHHISGDHSDNSPENKFTIYGESESLSEAIHKIFHAKKNNLLDPETFYGIGILYETDDSIKDAYNIKIDVKIEKMEK